MVQAILEYMKTCRTCGTEFKPRRGKANKYCAMACYRIAQKRGDYIGTRVTKVPCDTCGKPHIPSRSKKRDGSPADHQYCSRECYLEHHTKRFTVECAGCGKGMKLTRYRAKVRKYCSQECRIEHKRPDPINCRVCGVLFTPIQIRSSGGVVFKGDRTLCSDECFSRWASEDEERKRKIGDAFRGPNHPNWKGGRSYLSNHSYRGPRWNKVAARARKRAGYCCESCGKTQEENGRKLDVHHVIPFHNFESVRKANANSNLRVLCTSCHAEEEATIDGVQITIPLARNGSARRTFRILRGSEHHKAKLTEDIVRRARREHKAGRSLASLCREHGVTTGAMSAAVKRKTWKHVR